MACTSLVAGQIPGTPPAATTSPWLPNFQVFRPPPRNQFKTLAMVDTLAWSADIATTQAALLSGATELNPIFGRHPSPSRLWTTAILEQSIFLYACHRDSNQHPRGRFWKAIMKVSSAAHAGAAVNNVVALHLNSR